MCGDVPKCRKCGVTLTGANAYAHPLTSSGLQGMCKTHQKEAQARRRIEKRKKMTSTEHLETKLSGARSELRLEYNARSQTVEVTGPLEALNSGGLFWVGVFGKSYKVVEDKEKRTFWLHMAHVSKSVWDEATAELIEKGER